MQTNLADFIRGTPDGDTADAILRKCVHCGFCTATCPTYQLLGDELDGPRGRIYLIKQMLEGAAVTEKTQRHLDRCLTCRSCETTCPSGVEYHRLADIGRAVAAARVARPLGTRFLRFALREGLTRAWLFGPAYRLGQFFRPLLPASLKAKLLPRKKSVAAARRTHPRRMLMLAGCVQPAMAPNINAATARVLDRLGIATIEAEGAGCCGAVRLHLDDHAGARADARRNIDAWWPHLSAGAEAIVVTASGCGAHVRDYAHLLAHDPAYAAKAARVTLLARDIAEVLAGEQAALAALLRKSVPATRRKVAFHSPCSLQHGMRVRGAVESLLQAAGFELTPVADAHLCCGSAGTYSVLQPELSLKLRDNKLACLSAGAPAAVASANIGCIAHLQSGTSTPVSHWIELLDQRLES
ncbi:MAG: glycolate oxidase iron-sulfur subunit [Rhodocyclaceae bacterium]|nr:MAG: glycolate oxidase iron-sulfur subunit [Betaproteobacteria bacterium]GJQ55031.1 MAG: glycolate oxidase iron-sulfur subunit [Rhodocyclaceae bacterium]